MIDKLIPSLISPLAPFISALACRWLSRYAAPDSAALAAVARLTPAVAVTGGSSGIGLAIARAFSADGWTVVLIGRDAARLSDAKASFPATRAARVYTLALDVTAPDAATRIVNVLAALGLYLDVLVNAAGIGLAGPFESHDEPAISGLISLNVEALTRLTRHFLPGMRARARGGVLNVASLGGYVPGPNQAAYYASKAYVCSLTEALGSELAGSGVRMTVVAPGPVATSFHAAMGADNSLYRWLLPALSPEQTATAALSGFRLGRRVVVPGLIPKALAVLATVTPHWISLALMRWLLAVR